MNEHPDRHTTHRIPARLLERLETLVEAGRVTDEEAERLRVAAASGELDEGVRQIRLGHARATIGAAVEDGRLTQDEADASLERLHNGEDPRFLRGLRRHRPGA